jgi:uncharacterized repeat protein (TIGR03803 family)
MRLSRSGESPALAKGLTVLYSFQGYPDGQSPVGGVVVDKTGNVFGTTAFGGLDPYCLNGNQVVGCGTVFELSPSGSSYAEAIVHSFSAGTDGDQPSASPIEDKNGNLFVTALYGGEFGFGTLAELTPAASSYQEKRVYSFASGADGGYPYAGPFEKNGIIYATTFEGGGAGGPGALVAFKASFLAETYVYGFKGSPSDGAYPTSSLVADSTGALYGTTDYGGTLCTPSSGSCGTVFKFVPAHLGGTESVLWSFNGQNGMTPTSSVVVDKSGNIYGTTDYGGGAGLGVVYKLSPGGAGYSETILHTFTGSPDGDLPYGGLTQKGNMLYGTTTRGGNGGCTFGCGTIFQISTTGANYSVIHTFQTSDGAAPDATMVWNGKALYGTASSGGAYGHGEVFRLVP